jgi:hypothetical protein
MRKLDASVLLAALAALSLSACAAESSGPDEGTSDEMISEDIAGSADQNTSDDLVSASEDASDEMPSGAGAGPRWGVYQDKRFDITLEYPATWTLSPRRDLPEVIGEVVTLSSPVQADGRILSIFMGHYLQEIDESDTLAAWTARYPKAFDSSFIETTFEHDLMAQDGLAHYVRGASPLGEYQYTNIRRGNLVWFIWANFGDSADTTAMNVYHRVVDSFRFDSRAPRMLRDILPTVSARQIGNGGRFNTFPMLSGSLISAPGADLANTWWSPVLKSNGQQWPVTCGSSAHAAGAYYAADVGATENWQVLAARSGKVEFSGWDTSGYGNLVKIGPSDGTGHRHLYGHLIGIFAPVVTGSSIGRESTVGWVGGTGNVTGVHLHFHVQDGLYQSSSNGVSLVGMTGFTDNPNDTYYPSNDGVSHPNCAWMGR